jgi:hypothetical protein
MNPPPRPNVRPWAIAGAVVVIGGLVAALLTAGGGGRTNSSANLPPGGQATVVKNAPAPRAGDRVLAASETRVHGLYYRVVASRPKSENPKTGTVDVFFNEYVGSPQRLLQRVKAPGVAFFNDSVIAGFMLEARPDPNPKKAAALTFAWFHHAGDQDQETNHYAVSPQGIGLN